VVPAELFDGASFLSRLLLLNLTGPNWGWQEMQKGQILVRQTDIQKVGARCVGCSVEMHNSLIASHLF
jgi:hypothetical protein